MVTTAALVARDLLWADPSESFVSPYKASACWVTYADGFVRRGLPGEILKVLAGGTPTPTQATILAAGLVLAATSALVILVTSVARVVQRPDDRLFVIALVTVSPFTFSLLDKEIGRLESIGVVVMAVIAALARGGEVSAISRLVRAAAMSASVAMATACEELLFAFVAPLAVLGLYRLGYTRGKLLALATVVVAPGAVLAAMSVLLRPSQASLVVAISKANAEGIPVDVTAENSISTLGQSATQGLEFTLGMSALTVATCLLLFGGCYLLTTAMIRYVVRPDRLAWALIATFGVAALLLSAIGNDYGRWWALAFVAVVAGLAMLGSPSTVTTDIVRRARGLRLAGVLLACAVLVFSVRLQLLNVWPDWDPTADTAFSIDRLAHLDPNWS